MSERHLRLMAWLDGELSPDEAAAVAAEVAADPELRAVAEGLRQVDDAVAEVLAERLGAAPDLTADILARIEADGRQAAGGAAPTRERAVEVRRPATVHRLVPWVGGALAAAAALAVVFRSSPPPPAPVASAPPVVASPVPAPVAVAPAAPAVEPSEAPGEDGAASIEAVDFGTHPGTIFVVSEDEGSMPIVWLTDDA